VEKFVFPYYASKSLWEAAAVLRRLSYHWYGCVPPDTDAEPPAAGVVPRFGPSDDATPYAVAHTPDSQFTTVKEPTGGTRHFDDLHLLVSTPNGVEARALSALPDPPADWRPCHGEGGRGPRRHGSRGGA
jgi:hypothetical protein